MAETRNFFQISPSRIQIRKLLINCVTRRKLSTKIEPQKCETFIKKGFDTNKTLRRRFPWILLARFWAETQEMKPLKSNLLSSLSLQAKPFVLRSCEIGQCRLALVHLKDSCLKDAAVQLGFLITGRNSWAQNLN